MKDFQHDMCKSLIKWNEKYTNIGNISHDYGF